MKKGIVFVLLFYMLMVSAKGGSIGKLNSIELCLVLSHGDHHCYENKVSIKLFYGRNNSESCNTNTIINDDHGKDNLEWNGVELGNCSEANFDMDVENLKFIIDAERGHESCKDPFSKDESLTKRAKRQVTIKFEGNRGKIFYFADGQYHDDWLKQFRVASRVSGSALHYGWVVSGPIQITLSILGVIGNVLSIIVFTRPTMKSDINFILIALGCSDLLFVLTGVPRGSRIVAGGIRPQLNHYFTIYPIIKSISQFAYTSSIYLTVTLIVERYLAFVRPNRSSNNFKRTKLTIAAVVISAFIYNVPVWFEYKWADMHGTTNVVQTDLKKSKHHDFVYHALFGNTVKFLVPTISLVVFSILIIRELRKLTGHFKRNSTTTRAIMPKVSKVKAKEKTLAMMSMTIVSLFIFCNSFYTIYYILDHNHDLSPVMKLYLQSTARVFTVINCSANAIIYLIFNKKFRKTFVALFWTCSAKEAKQITTQAEATTGKKIQSSDAPPPPFPKSPRQEIELKRLNSGSVMIDDSTPSFNPME